MQKLEEQLRQREGQIRRLHSTIKEYRLNEQQTKTLQANKQQLQQVVEHRFNCSSRNIEYRFPKLSVQSQFSQPDSLKNSVYNLFDQNPAGPCCDPVLYPDKALPPRAEVFFKKERTFLEQSKKNISMKKELFQQRKKKYDNLIEKDKQRRTQTQAFQPGELMKFSQQPNDNPTSEEYLANLLRKFKAKENAPRSTGPKGTSKPFLNKTDRLQLGSSKLPVYKSQKNDNNKSSFNKSGRIDIANIQSQSKQCKSRERMLTDSCSKHALMPKRVHPSKSTKENQVVVDSFRYKNNTSSKELEYKPMARQQPGYIKELSDYLNRLKKDRPKSALGEPSKQKQGYGMLKMNTADVSGQIRRINTEKKGTKPRQSIKRG